MFLVIFSYFYSVYKNIFRTKRICKMKNEQKKININKLLNKNLHGGLQTSNQPNRL